MKKLLFFFCLLSFLLLKPIPSSAATRTLGVIPLSPSGTEVIGEQWLFVIGIDTYISWPRLETAVNDAKTLRSVLLEKYYFDENHLIELYNEEATRKNILGKLRLLAKKLKKNDSLVVFYAGHGHLDPITKAGSWIPVESGVEDTSAWISNHDIKNYLKVDAIKAKHVLLISDSCFAGDFFRGKRGKLPAVTDTVIKKAYKLSSRQAITSGGLEPVSDTGFGNHSVFSHFLIDTLKQNQKPFLIPTDFFPNIKAGVVENAEQFPQFGSLQGTGGQQGGELLLFLKQENQVRSLSKEVDKKSEELKKLQRLEAEISKIKTREAKEIAEQQKEIASLDKSIIEMKKRLGTTYQLEDDSLDTMLAMIQQQEDRYQQLEELKKKRIREEKKRQDEMFRLKKEQQKKREEAFESDIEKYNKIAKSQFGKSMIEPAWKTIIEKWSPKTNNLKPGDIDALRQEIYSSDYSTTGIMYDISTGLEWYAGPDKNTTWKVAKRWAMDLTIDNGGWRLPTVKELETLYEKGTGTYSRKPIMKSSGTWVWSDESDGNLSRYFSFKYGRPNWCNNADSVDGRGFAVRSHAY